MTDPDEAVASAAASAALEGIVIDPEWLDAVRAALAVAGGVDDLIAQRTRDALSHASPADTARTYLGVPRSPEHPAAR